MLGRQAVSALAAAAAEMNRDMFRDIGEFCCSWTVCFTARAYVPRARMSCNVQLTKLKAGKNYCEITVIRGLRKTRFKLSFTATLTSRMYLCHWQGAKQAAHISSMSRRCDAGHSEPQDCHGLSACSGTSARVW